MNGTFESYIAQVFLIIGLLVFAKQAPKLIETLVGSISGGSWRISKKLNGEDYEYVRRGGVGAGAVGAGLGRTAFNTFFKKNDDGTWGARSLRTAEARRNFASNFGRQLLDLRTNVVGNAYRGIRDGNVSLGDMGSTIGNVMDESQRILDERNQARDLRRQERMERLEEMGGLFNGRYIPGVSEIAGRIVDFVDNGGSFTKNQIGEGLHAAIGGAIEGFENAKNRLGDRLNPSRRFSSEQTEALAGLHEEIEAGTKKYVKALDERYASREKASADYYKSAYSSLRTEHESDERAIRQYESAMSDLSKALTGRTLSGTDFDRSDLGEHIAKLEEKLKRFDRLSYDLARAESSLSAPGVTSTQKQEIQTKIDNLQAEIANLDLDPKLVADIAGTKSKIKDFKKASADRKARKEKADGYDERVKSLLAQEEAEKKKLKEEKEDAEYAAAYESMTENGSVKPEVQENFRRIWETIRRDAEKINSDVLRQAIKESGFDPNKFENLEDIFGIFIDGSFTVEDIKCINKLSEKIKKIKICTIMQENLV